MIKENTDRRTLYRIPNPGAVVRYKQMKKTGLFSTFSEPEEVINLSKSGLALNIQEPLAFGRDVVIKLTFKDGKTLKLKGNIRWQSKDFTSSTYTTGVQFVAFGRSDAYNSPKALEYLRSLRGQAVEKKFDQPAEYN